MGDGKRRAGAGALGARPTSRFPGAAARKEEVAALAARSSACLTLFKDVPVLATNSPNKLFDTFAAGPPGDREHGRLDARARGGQRRGPLRARRRRRATWPQKLAWLRDHPEEAARMGRNARALAEREFDRDQLAGRVLERARGGGARDRRSPTASSTRTAATDLLACLDAIERTHPPGVSHEVLVLDNASERRLGRRRVRERYPGGAR